MKNLFDFATSELSQDAFLCWLFENYNCENAVVKKASLELLRKMTGFENLQIDPKSELKTERQVEHTDVIVIFYLKGEKHILLIEDKTCSGVRHYQIHKYPERIASKYGVPKERIHCAIYKTDLKDQDEIEETKKEKDYTWNMLYLHDIDCFFSNYNDSNCLIFDQYREHIAEQTKRLKEKNVIKMEDWKNHGGKLLFRDYIKTDLFPLVEKRTDNLLDAPKMLGWHSYPSLFLWRNQKIDKLRLTMEISFHPTWDRAILSIRCSGDHVEVPKDFKYQLRNELTAKHPFFRGFCGKGSCIAHGKLYYNIGITKMTEEIEIRINEFAEISAMATQIISNNSEWETLFLSTDNA